MPVTELAILRLPPGTSTTHLPKSLVSKLRTAKEAMQSYSGYSFYYLQQVEDPAVMYIVGNWSSVDFHMNHWIPSSQNQQLLESLKDDIQVDSMFHVDVDQMRTPIPLPVSATNEAASGNSSGCKVLAIGRMGISPANKAPFQTTYAEVKPILLSYQGQPGRAVDGWRLDPETGSEEFVQFTGWDSVDQHFAFATSTPEEFKEYAKIRPLCDLKVEIKHAKLLDLGM